MLNSTPPLSGTTNNAQSHRTSGSDASGHDIRSEVKRTLDGSLEYQILRKTLIKEQDSQISASDRPAPDAAESPAAERPAAGTESVQAATANAEVAAELRIASERMRQRTEVEVRELRIEAGDEPVQKSDPLLLDLDGDGIETSGIQAGLAFDIDADGITDQTSFASNGDAFLALDRNGNGHIDDGSELFGDQHGHANGFDALADHDDNQDGIIDARDSIFQRLQLVTAAQGRMETSSLGAYGIAAIDLGYATVSQQLNPWDSIVQSGSFRFEDGRVGQAVDVMLGHRET